MALKSIGIIIALCTTLTIAIDREVRFQPEHEHYQGQNTVKHRARIEPDRDESVARKVHHTPHYSHSSKESEEREHFGFPKPHFSHSSEESGHYDLKPHHPHSSEILGERHGLPNLYFSLVLGESNNYDLYNSQLSYSPEGSGEHRGVCKPHFPHNSQESGEHHNLPKPHFSHTSQEQKWEHEIHHPDWYNPHFPQQPNKLKAIFDEMERRRPLFYPIYPFHPFYPHAHPTTNDEEFETIEALKGRNYQGSHSRSIFSLENESSHENIDQQKYSGPYYHGPHNPHFSMNPDSSENSKEKPFGPSYHGFPYPHFNPFHKEPAIIEENDVLAPSIFEHRSTINSDDFPTKYEAQPYGLASPSENDEGSQGPFIIIENEEEKFQIPYIIHDILKHVHHGHGKPHHHGDKPNEDEDIANEEGSGEEDIIPLSAKTNVPLIQDNA